MIFDADKGELSFRVDGGARVMALSGFPSGEPMRPWVRMGDCDVLSLHPSWEE